MNDLVKEIYLDILLYNMLDDAKWSLQSLLMFGEDNKVKKIEDMTKEEMKKVIDEQQC